MRGISCGGAPRDGHGLGDFDEAHEVPRLRELVALEERPVDEQDSVRLGHFRHREQWQWKTTARSR
jgi:hypothetical protein